MALSDELRKRRLQLQMTQDELAHTLQVSQQTISRWEQGTTAPGPRRIADLAAALSVDRTGLLRSAGYVATSVAPTLQPVVEDPDRLTMADLLSHIEACFELLRRRLGEPGGLPPPPLDGAPPSAPPRRTEPYSS